MLSALRSKFWRAYSDSKGIREAEIQFTDRYEALGIPHPDPETMCLGFCEGTGCIPVKMGKNGGRDGLATVGDETAPELVALWHQAEAVKSSPDGWHFVKCPECKGTGKRLSEVFRVTAPGREPKTFQKRVDAEAYRDRYPGSKITKISEQGIEAPKLTNERAKLRDADPNNKGERCGFCVFFNKPSVCKIVEGPVTADLVCDWIQSRGFEGALQYSVDDADWEAFVKGMIQDQPYQHIVKDGAMTPAGPMVLIEDTSEKPHRFSLTKEFHIGHTSFEHHWTQKEVDDLIVRGKSVKATEVEPSGGHRHPHDQDGTHSHPGLPSGGGHDHNGDGSHRHRPGDPLEGAHGNTGQGYHEHPLAAASMKESNFKSLRGWVNEDRSDFEVVGALHWIRFEELKPVQTAKWTPEQRTQFKTEAMEEAGKRGLFSGPKK